MKVVQEAGEMALCLIPWNNMETGHTQISGCILLLMRFLKL